MLAILLLTAISLWELVDEITIYVAASAFFFPPVSLSLNQDTWFLLLRRKEKKKVNISKHILEAFAFAYLFKPTSFSSLNDQNFQFFLYGQKGIIYKRNIVISNRAKEMKD